MSLPMSDQEMFDLLDAKVYRVIGAMLAARLPVKDFMGGRKHRDGQYTKLLAKSDNIAARIYDKIRFRLVTTRHRRHVFPVVNHLMRNLFPFNYVIPTQSTNTLFPFRTYVSEHPHLRGLSGSSSSTLISRTNWSAARTTSAPTPTSRWSILSSMSRSGSTATWKKWGSAPAARGR